MTPTERHTLLDRYKRGYAAVVSALEGITDDQLDRHPEEGGWTAREIVHHLADSEMTSAIRLRRLLVEDHPRLDAYDEEAFARRLFYDRPIAASLEALRAARLTSSEILDRLSEPDWTREGTHSDSGRYTVENWLEIYAAHAHDHANQIRRARGG